MATRWTADQSAPTSGVWTVAGTAVAEREEAVRHALGDTHLPWDLRVNDPAAYACDLAWHTIGDATLVECRSDPVTGRRRSAEIGRTGAETVAVLLVLSGRERVRQEGVAVELGAGDALLWGSGAPVDFEVLEPLHKVTLLVPADRVAALRPRQPLGPVAMVREDASVRLLTGHLQTLAGVGAGLSLADSLFAVDMTLDLLVRAIDPVASADVDSTPAARGLREAALAIISRDLADQGLTPAHMAARLGITPRYLHMIFTATGETVAASIRRRRLERVRQDLADPRCDGDTVTTIAFRWGFNDSGQLSRAFRAAHRMTPSTYRTRARARRR